MSDEFDELLGDRLDRLGSDLGDTSLPGPAAARRRAAQRTRHQITGVALTGIAAVAAGALALGQDAIIAEPEPPPPAQTSEPSPPDATAAGAIPPGALLSVDDLPDSAAGTWTETNERGVQIECEPVFDGMDLPHQNTTFVTGDERVSHDLVRVPEDSAAGMVAEIRAQVEACLPDRQSGQTPQVTDEYEVREVGDQGWLIRYYTDPEDQDAPVATIGLVRYRDIVSLTVRAEPTRNIQDTDGTIDHDTPVRATERMCAAVFDADCVGDPQFVPVDGGAPAPEDTDAPTPGGNDDVGPDEPVEPAPSGEPDDTGAVDPDATPTPGEPPEDELPELADDPFLTDDDIDPVGTYEGFTRVGEDDPPDIEFEARCLTNLNDVGVDVVHHGQWFQELGDGYVDEYVLQLPDAEPAMRLITDHTILPEQCGDVPDDREQTVGEPAVVAVEGADEALVWTVASRPLPSNPGSSTSFAGVGMARVGTIVVVVTFGAMDDPTEGGWADYAARTLALAVDRAIA